MNKPDISAALIVKNESRNIKRAIDSLKAFCREIIIVDTGSDDDTPIIASQMGCEIYHFTWINDFAAARNYALRFICSEWVIFLDADEIIDYPSLRKNLFLLDNSTIGGLSCILKNYTDTQLATYTEHRYTRIFRNDKHIRYTGAIHEQIAESIISCGLQIAETDVIIEHFGYIDSSTEKKNRNLSLLNVELAKNPDDDWVKYHIANTHFSDGQLEESKRLFSEIIESESLNTEQIEFSKLRLLQIALSQSNWEYIFAAKDETYTDSNFEGLRLFILASYYLHKADFANAKKAVAECKTKNSSLVSQDLLSKAGTLLGQLP